MATCIAQSSLQPSESAFLTYLSNNQLDKERILFLKELKIQNKNQHDTLCLLLAKAFFNSNINDSAHYYIDQVSNSYLVKINQFEFKLGLLLQFSDTNNVQKLINSMVINNDSHIINETKILNSLIFNKNINYDKEFLSEFYPFDVCNKISNYQHLLNKKTGKAVFLSMILPGLGKMYLGRKQDGINMLMFNVATGSLFLESFLKKGLVSFYTIPSISLFAVFYLGNIYGTYKAVNILKHESYKDMLYHLGVYYANK